MKVKAHTTANRCRVLYVARFDTGGTTISLYELLRGMDNRRYEPVVLFYKPNYYCDEFRKLGVKVLVLSEGATAPAAPLPKPVRDLAASLRKSRAVKQVTRLIRQEWPLARRMARLIREEAVDLVSHNDNLRAHRASVMAARLAGVPQVCHIRSLTSYFRPIDRCLSSVVDFFIYISSAIEKQCREDIGIAARKGQVIYDPVDLGAYADVHGATSPIRAEFGFTDGERVIANVGRLVSIKGQDFFLQAMAQVVRTHPNAKALLVGAPESTPAGQAYYGRLKQLVADMGLSDHVIFTGFRTDIPQIMAASDIVVHSASEPEGLGRVLVEAMAAGRPVIGTAAGGVPDVVQDRENGLLVPMADPASMAEAIQRLLRDPARARLMGQRAKQTVQARFTIRRHVEAVQGVYERVLRPRGGRGSRWTETGDAYEL